MCLSLETCANDTIVRLEAGGIEFLKSEDIRILEEVLEISRGSVRVRYRFLDESDQDIHATVAFPFPPRPPEFHRSYERFMSTFLVLVDGRPVSTKTDQADAVYWQQSFPAGKETIVEHTYIPLSGGRYDVPIQEGYGDREEIPYPGGFDYTGIVENIYFLKKDSCLEAGTRESIAGRMRSLVAKGIGWVTVKHNDVEYILGTGRNWKGPIGVFELRVERSGPNQFTSVCFPGASQQTNPTVHEFVQRDFMPPDTLVVNFYTVEGSPVPDDEKLNEDEQSLIWSASYGNLQEIRAILDRGTDINATSQGGWTPLMWAAEGGHAEIVKVLLERGALTHSKNKKGWTAVELARDNGHKEVVELLKAHGAKE